MTHAMRIAVIGGDGIGPEVIAEAVKVLRATVTEAKVETTAYDLGAGRWLRTGETLPRSVLAEDGRAAVGGDRPPRIRATAAGVLARKDQ